MPDTPPLRQRYSPPVAGQYDGLDPASQAFPDQAAFLLRNIRVSRGKWETRFGMSFWRSIGGSGTVHFLGRVVDSDGNRYTLAAQGGVLYDFEEDGGDASFQPVTDGDGLATNLLQGVQLGNYFYFTDRAGALLKYLISPTSAVFPVSQPGAPPDAPTVTPYPWGMLEDWSSPSDWVSTNAPEFFLVATNPATDEAEPTEDSSVKLVITPSAVPGNRLVENVSAGEPAPSDTVALWFYYSGDKSPMIWFMFGQFTTADARGGLLPPQKDQHYPKFIPITGIDPIRFKQLRLAKKSTNSGNVRVFISPLWLPGRLGPGKYRWAFTHYRPADTGVTAGESSLSPASAVTDFSTLGTDYHAETEAGFKRTALVGIDSDAASDATTTKIRLYRSGGVPELTQDANGRPIWILVAEVNDYKSTITCTGGTKTGTVGSSTGLAVGDWVQVDKSGSAGGEFNKVTVIAGAAVTFRDAWQSTHTAKVVQMAYQDNTPDRELDPTLRIEPERDDPPEGVLWVAKTSDDRLVLMGPGDLVCISNKGTPDRESDYEVFPAGVDPLIRQSLLQGWRFRIGGTQGGETIMWGGFFRGVLTILTRTGLYQINAQSQVTWGPESVVKVLDNLPCVAGEAVVECNGSLYWPSDQGRIVRWDGQSAPQVVSALKVSETLKAAPSAYWNSWFARACTKRDGQYYQLCIVPAGATTAILWLEFNVDTDVWEPADYYVGATAQPWGTALTVRTLKPAGSAGAEDIAALYAAHPTTGNLYLLDDETADDDNGEGIHFHAITKKHRLPFVGGLERFRLRLAAADDALAVTVTIDGSEYGENSANFTVSLDNSGADTGGEAEIRERLAPWLLRGAYVWFELAQTVLNRPQVREIEFDAAPVRENWIGQ